MRKALNIVRDIDHLQRHIFEQSIQNSGKKTDITLWPLAFSLRVSEDHHRLTQTSFVHLTLRRPEFEKV